jgi:hypothetical protein
MVCKYSVSHQKLQHVKLFHNKPETKCKEKYTNKISNMIDFQESAYLINSLYIPQITNMFNPECQDSSLYYQQPATSHGKTEKDNA